MRRKTTFSLLTLLLLTTAFGAYFYWKTKRRPGAMETMALLLARSGNEEWCDRDSSERRLFVLRVLDRYRPELLSAWRNVAPSGVTPKNLVPFGPIYLRRSEPGSAKLPFDRTVFDWTETYLKLQSTQRHANEVALWKEIDASARYLMERDVARVIKRVEYKRPERTEHSFVPNVSVRRTSISTFTVALDPGDFEGNQEQLKSLIEKTWRSPRHKVLVEWRKGAYRFHVNPVARKAYVSHSERKINIVPYDTENTLAHEVGHVLGFDDHYYNVWHKEHCYYTQEFRTADLMSNSHSGKVTARHWQLLEQAYPWKREPSAPFKYIF